MDVINYFNDVLDQKDIKEETKKEIDHILKASSLMLN